MAGPVRLLQVEVWVVYTGAAVSLRIYPLKSGTCDGEDCGDVGLRLFPDEMRSHSASVFIWQKRLTV